MNTQSKTNPVGEFYSTVCQNHLEARVPHPNFNDYFLIWVLAFSVCGNSQDIYAKLEPSRYWKEGWYWVRVQGQFQHRLESRSEMEGLYELIALGYWTKIGLQEEVQILASKI